MKARLAIAATALETLVMVGIGVGVFFAPLSLVWALDDQFATDLLVYWRASADFWLLGHGVPVTITLGPEWAQSLGLVPGQESFVLSAAPLGPAVLTLWWGIRMGRRDLALDHPVAVWLTALGVLVAASAAIYFSAQHPAAEVELVDALVRPSLFLATGMVIASWSSKWSPGRRWLEDVLPAPTWQLIATGVRAGIAAIALLWGSMALFFAGSLLWSYAGIISLFESLGPSVVGLVVLFVGQLALIPTIVVWLGAWASGAGFFLGGAAQFTPLATDIQALPALPLFAALPAEPGPRGFAVIAVPLVAAVLAGALSERFLEHRLGDPAWWIAEHPLTAQPVVRSVLSMLIATLTAVAIQAPAALLVTGSLGPGRFGTVGVDVSLFLGAWAAEVFVGVGVGLMVGRAARWIRENERTLHPSGAR